jgi:hypothetical protein
MTTLKDMTDDEQMELFKRVVMMATAVSLEAPTESCLLTFTFDDVRQPTSWFASERWQSHHRPFVF